MQYYCIVVTCKIIVIILILLLFSILYFNSYNISIFYFCYLNNNTNCQAITILSWHSMTHEWVNPSQSNSGIYSKYPYACWIKHSFLFLNNILLIYTSGPDKLYMAMLDRKCSLQICKNVQGVLFKLIQLTSADFIFCFVFLCLLFIFETIKNRATSVFHICL